MNKTRTNKKFKRLIRLMDFYPPYLFSGINVVDSSDDFTYFKVRLKLTWYNKNLLRTAFGGSLYAMCDPFFMLILMINLVDSYIVWDKAASIDFVKTRKRTVFAEFKITSSEIAEIRSEVNQLGKKTFTFPCQVIDDNGNLITKLTKDVDVRKKGGKST